MRVVNCAVAGLLAGVGLAGCSSAPLATFTRYQYTCCDAADVVSVWHPGQTLTVHWTAHSVVTTDSTTRTVSLTVALRGPYRDVNSLKQGGDASTSLAGAPLTASDGTPSSPVSVIVLPPSLATGFYNLTETVSSTSGSSSGSSVVQVAPGR
ncbi:MAG: hypothetical protein M3Z57_06275 [Candidatus Dormibacteraeota bacterium]|nr:hypothetical protein [Candidatus Dormibacteraeota bacterium]